MFTTDVQKNVKTAKEYFASHLCVNDDHPADEMSVGRWIGGAGERLGLFEGEPVDARSFVRLCDNQRPTERGRLTQRQRCDRRVLFDFVVSAPKSLSIMAVIAGDERLEQLHALSARAAMRELERFAKARVRKNNRDEDRSTGNVLGAEFQHDASRALDPQVHTHFALFNATFDPLEKVFKALQARAMFDRITYATEVYRNHLVNGLHAIGYATYLSGESFEILGVSSQLLELYSKRAKQRDAAVERKAQQLGRALSNDEIAHLIHRTRAPKIEGVTNAQIRQQQLTQISEKDLTTLRYLKAQATGIAVLREKTSPEAALTAAIYRTFSRDVEAAEEQILRAALVEGRGDMHLAELRGLIWKNDLLVQIGRAAAGGMMWSTKRILEAELLVRDFVQGGRHLLPPLVETLPSIGHLTPEMQSAVGSLVNSSSRFVFLEGVSEELRESVFAEVCRIVASHQCVPMILDCPHQKLPREPAAEAAGTALQKSLLLLRTGNDVAITDVEEVLLWCAERNCRAVFAADSYRKGGLRKVLEGLVLDYRLPPQQPPQSANVDLSALSAVLHAAGFNPPFNSMAVVGLDLGHKADDTDTGLQLKPRRISKKVRTTRSLKTASRALFWCAQNARKLWGFISQNQPAAVRPGMTFTNETTNSERHLET